MSRPFNALPIDDLVRNACRGSDAPLRELLLRRGGLPGPRPNFKLAVSVAAALVAEGQVGRKVIDEMRAINDNDAPAGSAYPILPIVGILGLGCAAAKADDTAQQQQLLDTLQEHAEDSRREIRDAVAVALGIPLTERPSDTLEGLANWSDGYFHAELMLRAVSEPAVLQKLDDARLPLSRIQEAFALAADAPRAHQRSQGYRALVRSMKGAIVALGKRFPHPVAQWLEENAQVATKDLLEALNESLDQLRSSGLRAGDAMAVHNALEAAIPPPRDPRWDVGTTRGRGKKARKKGRGR
jgi:hypothetical protein